MTGITTAIPPRPPFRTDGAPSAGRARGPERSGEPVEEVSAVAPRQGERRAAGPEGEPAEVASAAAEDARIARDVARLQTIDRQVRAHEQAHMAASGGLVRGGASFSYTVGPDGRRYAVGGEVSIDTSPVAGDPQATLEKAAQIRRAALAPANPSAQDLQVAAQASAMAQEARAELVRQQSRLLRAEQGDTMGARVDLMA